LPGDAATIEVPVDGAPPLRATTCHVVAEAGANHNNSIDRAIEMSQRAAAARAWAIKFQMYKADSLTVPASPKYWSDEFGTTSQHEAFKLSDKLDYLDFAPVADACRDLGIVFFATPFDEQAVDALEQLRAPIYKVASGDITHRPLLELIAETGKPVLLSTGAATEDEIEAAVGWLGGDPTRVVLLVCTLTYPTPDADGNFARIPAFRQRFAPYLIGMSDHTLGTAGGWMTAALGGVCIEKHYTLDKALPDVPDHAMSVDPDELADLVVACERGAQLRGDPWIGVRESELPAREGARRSVVLLRDVPEGTVLTPGDLGFKRPGGGLPPSAVDQVVGRRTARALARGHAISVDDLA
jgi:sialic acid synthase SpsE